MLTVSIVEEIEKDAAPLEKAIESYFERAGSSYVLRRFAGGADLIRSNENSDIIFISMHMERLDGLETARILRKLGSEAQLIFISEKLEMAIHGYEVDALDFIIKPFSLAAIDIALDKAIKRIEKDSSTTLALKLRSGLAGISSNDIKYIEVFDHDLEIHTVKGDFNVRGKLADMYDKLDKNRFFMCNRSYIVNLWHVTEVYSDCVMLGDTKITVSKSHRREISERFSDFLRDRGKKA